MILKPISTVIEMPKRKADGTPGPVRKHRLSQKRPAYDSCPHGNLQVSMRERKVVCLLCNKDMDPFDAFEILCRKAWWEEQHLEAQLEYEEKRVRKVQYAALEALYSMGVTPSKYLERWDKEHARRQAEAATASIKQEPAVKVYSENGDNPPAA